LKLYYQIFIEMFFIFLLLKSKFIITFLFVLKLIILINFYVYMYT